MTKIKTIVSEDWAHRLEHKVSTGKSIKNGSVTLPKYEAFAEVFGLDNFGFVSIADLIDESKGGSYAPVMKLDDNFMPYSSKESGLESRVLFTSGFRLNGGRGVPEDQISEVFKYLENQRLWGSVGDILNSTKSNLFRDKKSYIELDQLGVPIPGTYHFDNFDAMSDFVKSENGSYVMKPRIGFDGFGVEKVNSSNVSRFSGYDIESFVLQDEVDIASETRLIFCDGDFMGSRIIHDRTRPWEESGYRGHSVSSYEPTSQEIEDSKSIIEHTDTYLGCIDWIYNKDGERFFLETNGAATGLGHKDSVYDLNMGVAEKVRDKFFS